MNLRKYSPILALFLSVQLGFAAETAGKVRFEREMNALANSSRLKVGYAIKDLVAGDEFVFNGDTAFPQGSNIRIHLVAELFRQDAAKKLSIHDVRSLPEAARVGGSGVLRFMDSRVALTLRDYAVLTITINDNTAANFLSDIVGLENVNASLVAQGTPEIRFQHKTASRRDARLAFLENTGTPRAVMRALTLIHRGEVVNRETSDAILDVLALPEISYFRRELPVGVKFAGRSGSGPTFRCDEGVVLLEGHPYVFSVMVDGIAPGRANQRRDYTQADDLILQMSKCALDYFARTRSSTAPTTTPK